MPVKKVIESARANADYDHGYKPETLKITEITVNGGPSYKRFKPIARGGAHPYQLRTSHISVTVDGEKRAAKSNKPKAESSKLKAGSQKTPAKEKK
ncbi:MAG: uL22 family ribosomal protein [Candidatus Saccharibacteria bacterium]|nr:uL22 family ribosomal protein [Candidatus Saccharibacteria bacterium]